MLFQLIGEDHIRIVDEHAAADVSVGENTFGSEQELQRVASTWPMKRLLEIADPEPPQLFGRLFWLPDALDHHP